jgi:predicted nucleic acid-binding protein
MKKSTKPSTITKTFVGTSGFYALLVQADPMHKRASEFVKKAAQSKGCVVTSDYILDETETLLKARGQGYLADAFFQTVFTSKACQMEWMDPNRFAQTHQFFLKHHDKDWSFTDCFSFLIMRSSSLRAALTTDAHFRQAGFHALLI